MQKGFRAYLFCARDRMEMKNVGGLSILDPEDSNQPQNSIYGARYYPSIYRGPFLSRFRSLFARLPVVSAYLYRLFFHHPYDLLNLAL